MGRVAHMTLANSLMIHVTWLCTLESIDRAQRLGLKELGDLRKSGDYLEYFVYLMCFGIIYGIVWLMFYRK